DKSLLGKEYEYMPPQFLFVWLGQLAIEWDVLIDDVKPIRRKRPTGHSLSLPFPKRQHNQDYK
ncbi:MAG: hypothetical protein MUO27_11945, partial [Sedimentisphaerales bacterium]|nr:hypothetical protein [Sedimentisphaerales bacterium]